MAVKRFTFIAVIFAIVISEIIVQGVGNADEVRIVRGIVESAVVDSVSGRYVLTVINKRDVASMHDITGVQALGNNEEPVMETGSALRGKKAKLLLRDGKVVSLYIFSPIPE